MNISVLIPTRLRVRRLIHCMKSVLSTAWKPEEIEFILRLHEDDRETLREIPSIESVAKGRVHTIVGPNLGHRGDPCYFWELSQKAQGRWIWGLNDDVVILPKSKEWDMRIIDQPTTGVVGYPFYSFLGANVTRDGPSFYRKEKNNPFVLLPNRWWVQFGLKQFEGPTDVFIRDKLLKEASWKRVYIGNLTLWHDRRVDKLMKEEKRK